LLSFPVLSLKFKTISKDWLFQLNLKTTFCLFASGQPCQDSDPHYANPADLTPAQRTVLNEVHNHTDWDAYSDNVAENYTEVNLLLLLYILKRLNYRRSKPMFAKLFRRSKRLLGGHYFRVFPLTNPLGTIWSPEQFCKSFDLVKNVNFDLLKFDLLIISPIF